MWMIMLVVLNQGKWSNMAFFSTTNILLIWCWFLKCFKHILVWQGTLRVTYGESRSHTSQRINPGAVASSSEDEDMRHVVHCLSCYYAPFHLLYQLKNGLQVSQIKEVNVVVRSLRRKDNRDGCRSSSLKYGNITRIFENLFINCKQLISFQFGRKA